MSESPNGTQKNIFTVINTAGIHLRPAQLIARVSSSYGDCEVTASKDDIHVNAKSIMGITELIGSCGSRIAFEVSGPRAAECLAELGRLFEEGFGEDIDAGFARA